MTPTRQRMLDAEEAAWRDVTARFDSVADDVWERAGVHPGWSLKDLLAHIACWHAEAAQQLERAQLGEPVRIPDVEAFNRDAHDRCREMTLREVRAMSGAARHRFREELARAPDPIPEDWARLFKECAEGHYAEHAPDLDRFLESGP